MAGGDVKFLGNGEAVVVLGEGPPRATTNDGGRTVEEVDTVAVLRVPLTSIEYLEAEALLDERPELDPDTNLPVKSDEQLQAEAEAKGAPQIAPQGTTSPKTAEQLEAEIEERQRELAVARGEDPGKRTTGEQPQHERAAEERREAGAPPPQSGPPAGGFQGPQPPR